MRNRMKRPAALMPLCIHALASVALLSPTSALADPGTCDTTVPAGYALAETITVPTTGASVFSSTLQSGVNYKIRGCGTVALASDGRPVDGDAEYQFSEDHTTFVQDAPSGCVDVGIGINDTVNDGSKFPSWGAFSQTHNYTIDFLGAGAPIGLNFHDCFYENVGSLTVLIFAPTAAAVTFRTFSATQSRQGVLVQWRTASELDMLGFNVYREVNGKRVRVNSRLIAGKGRGLYSFLDRRAPKGKIVRYWVQAVNLDGSRRWHGPARVTQRR